VDAVRRVFDTAYSERLRVRHTGEPGSDRTPGDGIDAGIAAIIAETERQLIRRLASLPLDVLATKALVAARPDANLGESAYWSAIAVRDFIIAELSK
jgi:hypothetical protein